MPLSSSASSFFDRLFWRPAIRFLVPLSRSAVSYSDRLFWRPAFRFPVPLSRSASPFFDRLFWRRAIRFSFLSPAPSYSDRLFWRPAIRFPVPLSHSAASPSDRLFYRPDIRFSVPHLPLRLVLFWPAILTPRSPFSGTPGPSFHSPFWYPWSSFSTPSFFPPPNLPFPVIWVAGSLFVPPYGWPAVFTAPRFLPPRGFLPLRGFYRSAVFTAPLSPVLWGALLFHRPRACCPPVFPTSGRLALWATLRYAWDFYRSAFFFFFFTAPRFFPLRDFYRSAVFTAPRFLPLRGFYRSAVFTAPRFFFYRSAFTGSLGGFALPLPSSLLPPRLPPLPGGSLFGPPYGTPAVFTAPRFLPLRDFYRSAVFTAPRFLPLRDFYRSAVFTAPRFFSAPLSPVLWGALLFLSAPQSSPSSGRTLCYRLLRSVSGGTPFWSSFCTTCLTALGAFPLISPVSLLCISYTLGDHRSSRLLNDGTRAPRVLPPPSWDLSAIGN